MRIKPQLVENNHRIITFLWFYEELVDLGRVLGFSPRVLWFEVP